MNATVGANGLGAPVNGDPVPDNTTGVGTTGTIFGSVDVVDKSADQDAKTDPQRLADARDKIQFARRAFEALGDKSGIKESDLLAAERALRTASATGNVENAEAYKQ